MRIEYNRLADIYEPWSAADPAETLTLRFYIEICRNTEDTIVELGIGNGRIAIEIAERYNKHIVGIDISDEMLSKCQVKAKSKGVEKLIQLINADFRDFNLSTPVALIIMPFRTFGHLLTKDDKLAALRQIYNQLELGGKFVFDHYVFNENWARTHNGVPRLMCRSPEESTGKIKYVWDTYLYNFDTQIMDCTITVEEVEIDGKVISRRHHPLSFSWVTPDQVRNMVKQVGFKVQKLYGSFDKNDFNASSKEQIWIVQRPTI